MEKPKLKRVTLYGRVFYVLIYQTFDNIIKDIYMVTIAEEGFDFSKNIHCVSKELLEQRGAIKSIVQMFCLPGIGIINLSDK